MPILLLETIVIGAGTYLIRAGSLSFGSRIQWPDWAKQWLSFVTPAVLGALLGPILILQNNHLVSPIHNSTLLASIPTALVAWFTKHLLWTVFAGVVSFAIVTYVLNLLG